MAMYYYASKISALACGTRCKRTVLQKARGQRDRDKFTQASRCGGYEERGDSDMCVMLAGDGVRLRRRHSDQALNVDEGGRRGAEDGVGGAGIVLDFQNLEVSTATSTKTAALTGYGTGDANSAGEIVEYDIPKNIFKRSHSDVNYENSVLGSGGIMYINGRIVSGPLESLIEVLVPENLYDLDKEFIFSFLLSSRLFLRPHELLGKLVSSVPDGGESLESLVALLAEWTNKFPYDYRDERMMSHVKHIVARCSNTRLEGLVSEILSALLKRLTGLERHEEDLRACQTHADQTTENSLESPTAPHYAQILCRLEKKLAKHVGPEEFLQCSSNVLLDKQKKWDQPSTAGGPPGAQDPKKTCNLETYLDWSARLRLFVCNEILQCSGIRDRSRTVELWSGVAQYCLLVGNYNSATAILETLESPPLARLKITWSKLTVTCQQLDCMQRHAEGHGDLWQKQAIVLNENQHHHQQKQQQHQQQQQQHEEEEHQKTETLTSAAAAAAAAVLGSMTTSSTATTTTTADVGADVATMTTTTTPTTSLSSASTTMTTSTIAETEASALVTLAEVNPAASASASAPSTMTTTATPAATATDDDDTDNVKKATSLPPTSASTLAGGVSTATTTTSTTKTTKTCTGTTTAVRGLTTITTTTPSASASTKPNDWVVIPVFADIVKLALAGREDCLQRLPNGHINVGAFDRMAAIVGAFTKHMHTVKAATEAPSGGEYEMFCRHMQQTTKLNESELMMASFDCEEPNNAEKLMYDLN